MSHFRVRLHRSQVVIGFLLFVSIFAVINAPTTDALYAQEYGHNTKNIDTLTLQGAAGTVVKESDVGEVDQRVTVQVSGVGEFQGQHYFVRVKMPLVPRVLPSDTVKFSCTIHQPQAQEGFDYPRYLLRYHILGECSVFYADVSSPPEYTGLSYDRFYRLLIQAKIWMMQRIELNIPMPESSLVLGIVFGEMRALPAYLNTAFQRTGTTHLLVISGSNIALIIAWLSSVLQKLFTRKTALIICIIGVAIYTVMTGIQPSATRAAIFGTTVLWATVLGRPDQALRALVLTGCVMAIYNPLIAMIDAGFQLSFLASLAMILWSDALKKYVWMIPDKFEMREGASATLSATIMCTPLLAMQFQQISFISPLANLFLVPLMSAFLPIGIIQTALSSVSLQLGQIFALPFTVLLRYCIDLVQIGNGFTWAAVPITSVSGALCAVWYIGIACITLKRLFLFQKNTV